jgi:hypothetical protein
MAAHILVALTGKTKAEKKEFHGSRVSLVVDWEGQIKNI